MDVLYDPHNLSTDLSLFSQFKVLIIGSGAVGTYLAEFLAKLGVILITIVDFDRFTLANASKHSGIIRTPEDVGRPKSVATAQRAQALMVPGAAAIGLDLNVTQLGPMALSGYDAVFLALDNYAAKLVVNELFLRLPSDLRPILFMGGTNHELSQHTCLNDEKFCLRCLMSESWLRFSTVRTSCTGPQLWQEAGGKAPVTSNLASCKAALTMVDDFRRLAEGDTCVLNTSAAWFPKVHPRIQQSYPLPRKDCPDCASLRPPANIIPLSGSVYSTSLKQLVDQLISQLGHTDFELLPHVLRYAGIGHVNIIEHAACRGCGAKLPDLYRHEGRTTLSDLMCPDCVNAGSPPSSEPAADTVIRAFTPGCIPAAAAERSVFSLGWPIGGYIEVLVRNGCMDLLDDAVQVLTFTMADDQYVLGHEKKEAAHGT